MIDDARALRVGRLVLELLGELAPRSPAADDHLSESEAMVLTKRSKRQLSDARRRGDLTSYGGQRARTYRRAELLGWLEGMRSKPVTGVDDADIDRRVARLARVR